MGKEEAAFAGLVLFPDGKLYCRAFMPSVLLHPQ